MLKYIFKVRDLQEPICLNSSDKMVSNMMPRKWTFSHILVTYIGHSNTGSDDMVGK